MWEILGWIFQQGMVDLGYSGSNFTWFRGLNINTFKGATLDRGLFNVDWKSLFLEAHISHLPMIQSDHVPLLVKLNGYSHISVTKPFGFQMMWFSHPGFKGFILKEWHKEGTLDFNTI